MSYDATTNKLIILFVMEKMEMPLTESSIIEICSIKVSNKMSVLLYSTEQTSKFCFRSAESVLFHRHKSDQKA